MSSADRSVLVVGSVAVDDIDGPTGMQRDLLGGSASFISVAASYFTRKVALVAVVGDDFDEEHLEYFRSRGIETSGVERRPGKTFRWVGRYADDLATRTTLDTQLGVFAEFRPHLNDAHRAAEMVFLGNIDPALQLEVVEQVRRPGLIAADTMNFWIGGHRASLIATLKRVHTLLLNDEEARELAGEHNLVRAAAAIRRMGPHSVVIKRGDSGALLFHEDGAFAAPALPLEDVRDPTGAGDTFAGGFMGYLAYAGRFDPATVRAAMIYGSVMASFAVEQFSLDGLRNLTPAAIQARFDAFHELSRFDRIVL
ncbi:MAG TPA: PfkB family carbohydrate kinase [Kofleriaceae bacterium]|nr:PfkB family carbohydrate kinase [Kofleriaceae bacterium]